MKRPEGFDVTPAGVREQTRPRAGRSEEAASPPRERAPRPEKPAPRRVRDAEDAASTERKPSRASASRSAEAELRAAERARRRHEKQELRRFTRRTRRRRIAWLTGIGVVVALVAISLGAVYSPLLALRDIQVDGTTTLEPAQIADAIDGQLGVPLALLDETRLRDELGEFTLIRSYTTEILPPGTLIVHITERVPIGTVIDGEMFDLVDAAGVVLASAAKRPSGMPIIRVAEDEVDSPAYRSIAEVLSALPSKLRAKVDAIGASTHDDVTFEMAGSTQRVEWGSAENSDRKARVLSALLKIHGRSGPGQYDVSAPGTAVFRAD